MDQRSSLADDAHSLIPDFQSITTTTGPLITGLDIGGANIKAANSKGKTLSRTFPLWQKPNQLAAELRSMLSEFQPSACYAVTMTGELADCFLDRATGVATIVQQCQQALGARTLFYSVDGAFLSPEDAIRLPDHVAASNWHALASLVGPWCQPAGLLIDIGSTTCDLIPLKPDGPNTVSRTDFDRLKTGELIYLGIGRTPICSIVDALPIHGQFIPIMNEVFATMDDCALLLSFTTPSEEDCSTCDGRPRTPKFAANRFARMVGLDHRNVSLDDATNMADYVLNQWRARIQVATEILSPQDGTWILSGHGARLLEIPSDRKCVDLSAILGDQLSRAAPAFAVALLAQKKLAKLDSIPSIP